MNTKKLITEKYTKRLAEDYESRGIALMSGASYVLGGLDKNQLCMMDSMDFSKQSIKWFYDNCLALIRGKNGKQLIRFVSHDDVGNFIRLKPPFKKHTYATRALLNAELFEIKKFIINNIGNDILCINKPKKNLMNLVGLHIGDKDRHYSSLLSYDQKKMALVAYDVEPRDLPGSDEYTEFASPINQLSQDSYRSELASILDRLEPANALSTNTRVAVV